VKFPKSAGIVPFIFLDSSFLFIFN